eukprot:16297802-Heterocapsa_arctica.AAC.1
MLLLFIKDYSRLILITCTSHDMSPEVCHYWLSCHELIERTRTDDRDQNCRGRKAPMHGSCGSGPARLPSMRDLARDLTLHTITVLETPMEDAVFA